VLVLAIEEALMHLQDTVRRVEAADRGTPEHGALIAARHALTDRIRELLTRLEILVPPSGPPN
jgi:hypothetical protein